MFADINKIIKNTAEILKPPIRIPVSEAAEKFVRIDSPSFIGPWSSKVTPYMVEPMNLLSSRDYDAVIFSGIAQSGKTQALVDCWMAYIICCDPSDSMIIQTTIKTARYFSRIRLGRLHRHSPEIRKHVSSKRSEDNTHDKIYKSGMILSIGYPSINELSGKAVRNVALTDYDRMPMNVDGEGDPFSLAQKRTTTFMSAGMTVVDSSPGFDVLDPQWRPETPHEAPPTYGVLSLYNSGDRRVWYVPCPDCGEFFTARRGLGSFNIPAGDSLAKRARDARLECPSCGVLIDHSQKKEMNLKGIWLKDGQKVDKNRKVSGEILNQSRIASFKLHGIFAAFQSWESIIFKVLRGQQVYERTGDEQAIKSATNLDLGEAYLPKQLKVEGSWKDLESRSEDLGKRTVPPGVRFLVAGIDVQKHKFVVQVEGVGIGFERWIIDRFNIFISKRKATKEGEFEPVDTSAHLEDWGLIIDQVINKTYKLSDGSKREMRIRKIACDSGGAAGVTERAYAFYLNTKRKGIRNFMLVKGSGTYAAPKIKLTFPDSTHRRDRRVNAVRSVPLYIVNTNLIKDAIFSDLGKDKHGQNYIHFPDWLDSDFYRQLLAEKKNAKGLWVKVAHGSHNETFDLMVYCRAAMMELKADKIDWGNPPNWARNWEKNTDIIDPSEIVPVPEKQTKENGGIYVPKSTIADGIDRYE